MTNRNDLRSLTTPHDLQMGQPMRELVEIYNYVLENNPEIEGKPIKKFRNREQAVQRTWDVLDMAREWINSASESEEPLSTDQIREKLFKIGPVYQNPVEDDEQESKPVHSNQSESMRETMKIKDRRIRCLNDGKVYKNVCQAWKISGYDIKSGSWDSIGTQLLSAAKRGDHKVVTHKKTGLNFELVTMSDTD
jgi:hypothetical protein